VNESDALPGRASASHGSLRATPYQIELPSALSRIEFGYGVVAYQALASDQPLWARADALMIQESAATYTTMITTDTRGLPSGQFSTAPLAAPPQDRSNGSRANTATDAGPLAALSARQEQAATHAAPQRPRSDLPPPTSQKRDLGAMPSGLQQPELPLAGYLFARAADGRHVDDKNDLAALRAGDVTMYEVRQRLHVGRANVTTDIEHTNHESTHRKQAANALKDVLAHNQGRPLTQTQEAGVTMFAGAGNCSDYATLGAALHADKLQEGEMSVNAGLRDYDHARAEVLRSEDGSTDLVLDAWSNGPAVFREDSAFTTEPEAAIAAHGYVAVSGPEGRETVEFAVTGRKQSISATYPQGDLVRNHVNGMAGYAHSAYGPHFNQHVNQLAQSGSTWDAQVWEPTSGLDPEFVERVQEKLDSSTQAVPTHGPAPELLQDIVGAYVGRTMGHGVATAAKDAPHIVNAGKKLLEEAQAQALQSPPSPEYSSDSDSESEYGFESTSDSESTFRTQSSRSQSD
jgi:hypothetical protein